MFLCVWVRRHLCNKGDRAIVRGRSVHYFPWIRSMRKVRHLSPNSNLADVTPQLNQRSLSSSTPPVSRTTSTETFRSQRGSISFDTQNPLLHSTTNQNKTSTNHALIPTCITKPRLRLSLVRDTALAGLTHSAPIYSMSITRGYSIDVMSERQTKERTKSSFTDKMIRIKTSWWLLVPLAVILVDRNVIWRIDHEPCVWWLRLPVDDRLLSVQWTAAPNPFDWTLIWILLLRPFANRTDRDSNSQWFVRWGHDLHCLGYGQLKWQDYSSNRERPHWLEPRLHAWTSRWRRPCSG